MDTNSISHRNNVIKKNYCFSEIPKTVERFELDFDLPKLLRYECHTDEESKTKAQTCLKLFC